MEPLLIKVSPDATALTGLSRSKIYQEIAAGRIRTVRIGRAVRIPMTALLQWVEGLDPEDGATSKDEED